MTTFNPRPKDFTWAVDKNAHVKEPIQALKEKGWQYADVPTASNFNWLINELAQWDSYLEGRVNGLSDDLLHIMTSLKEENRQLKKDLNKVVSVLDGLIKKVNHHHPNPPLMYEKLPEF